MKKTKTTEYTAKTLVEKSRKELLELAQETRTKLANFRMSLEGAKSHEKTALRKGLARVLTVLGNQENS